MKYLNITDRAKLIRKDLKNASISANVRCSRGSIEGSIEVVLKSFSPLSEVKKITSKQESIDYCEYSGEILSGGNIFVNVSYSDHVKLPTDIMLLCMEAEKRFPVSEDYRIERSNNHHRALYMKDIDTNNLFKDDYREIFSIYQKGLRANL